MWLKSLVSVALIALLGFPAIAQTAAPAAPASQGTPTRIRGTIENFDGKTLTVKSREGADLVVALASNFSVRGVARVRLSEIKQGDYIAVAALPGADGKVRAQGIAVFPESMRGVGEGQRPWDLTPTSTMINATVAQVGKVSHGHVLHLQYKDGTADIDVPPRTPIVRWVLSGTPEMLKPGRAVLVFASKMPDGTYTSGAVGVQSGKVKPPL